MVQRGPEQPKKFGKLRVKKDECLENQSGPKVNFHFLYISTQTSAIGHYIKAETLAEMI